MDWTHHWLWHNGKLFGIEWGVWKVVGWVGNAIFSSRFLVQWYATEKHRQVRVPASFWWLSLSGSLALLSYALFYERDSVFIFAYAFTWIPYIRNLMFHYRHERASRPCPSCGEVCPPTARFCAQCGTSLARPESILKS